MKKFIFFFVILVINVQIKAQLTDFHPELNWYTIKGKHIEVHFHEGAERTARTVLKIAEEVWDPICSLYDYEPETVHFVIKDIDDYSNGAAFFFDNKIEIWASALDFDLRGTHNWLRNVITHEFTHMVQIQASMKLNRSVPAFYLQFMNYEDKRRQDILYGFPNFIASYPVATFNVPAWFAEGVAQYQRREFNYDYWDSHRDMILRMYALDGNMLTWNQMGVFGKSSLGNESVYNSGFALTLYIAQKYGEDKIGKLAKALKKPATFTIDKAFREVLGKDGIEVYNEWSSFLKKDYQERTQHIKQSLQEGDLISKEGFGNFYPVFNSDGSKMIYISNKNADYMGMTGLYLHDLSSGKSKLLQNGIRSTSSFMKDENFIIYSKLSEDNPNYSNIHDLYIYDIQEDNETRLTHGLRANNPSLSNDGKKITFVFQKDGTTNLGIIDLDGKNFKQLTFYNRGEQVYNPKFSKDDSYIVFGFSDEGNRDIAKVNTDGSGFSFLIKDDFDNRNPIIDKDNNLIYSSDKTGIFNIYKLNLETNDTVQITNVLGGAFMPDLDDNGNLAYAGYTSTGYKIYYLLKDKIKPVNKGSKYIKKKNPPLNEVKPKGDINNFKVEYLRNFNDKELITNEKKKYKGVFSKLTVLPFIRYDNYNTSNKGIDKIKPGVYITSYDMLNRFGFFAGASVNKRMERDIFFVFEYKNKLPLLYDLGIKPELSVELYSISRKTDGDLFFGADTNITTGHITYDDKVTTDITYNLFEVDGVFKHRLFAKGNDLEFRVIYSKYTSTLGSFIFPHTTILYPTTDDTYLKSWNYQLKLTHKSFFPYVDSDINPIGREIELQYNYERNQFNNNGEYEVKDGLLIPKYNHFNFHRLELNWKEHIQITGSNTLTLKLRAASILGPEMPDFFDFYLGGLIGMKSYPYYAISGNELGWLNIDYRFPLLRNIDTQLGPLYIDKMFLSFYGDFGYAWTGEMPSLNEFKKGAGAELRVKITSFYAFPTSIFFNASYSFDKFERYVKFRNETVHYGKEWRFYGGILFDFGL